MKNFDIKNCILLLAICLGTTTAYSADSSGDEAVLEEALGAKRGPAVSKLPVKEKKAATATGLRLRDSDVVADGLTRKPGCELAEQVLRPRDPILPALPLWTFEYDKLNGAKFNSRNISVTLLGGITTVKGSGEACKATHLVLDATILSILMEKMGSDAFARKINAVLDEEIDNIDGDDDDDQQHGHHHHHVRR